MAVAAAWCRTCSNNLASLRRSHFPEDVPIDVLLLHGTPRSPRERELARGNAVATLREVYHHLAHSEHEHRIQVNLINLGDDLHPEQFDAAEALVADYLLTHMNAAFRAQLDIPAPTDAGTRPGLDVPADDAEIGHAIGYGLPKLSEFGMFRMTAYAPDLLDRVAGLMSQEWLLKLLGQHGKGTTPTPDVRRSTVPTGTSPTELAGRSGTGQKTWDLLATEIVDATHVSPLELQQWITDTLETEPMVRFQHSLDEICNTFDPAGHSAPLPRLLGACEAVFGGVGDDTSTPRSPLGDLIWTDLGTKFDDRINRLIVGLAELTDRTGVRLAGAESTLRAVTKLFQQDEQASRQEAAKIRAELGVVARILTEGVVAGRTSRQQPSGGVSADEARYLSLEYLSRRRALVAVQVRRDMAITVLRRVQDLFDRTQDLSRALGGMARDLATERELLESLAAGLGLGRNTSASAGMLRHFLGAIPRLVHDLSERSEMTTPILPPLERLLTASLPLPADLLVTLRRAAMTVSAGGGRSASW